MRTLLLSFIVISFTVSTAVADSSIGPVPPACSALAAIPADATVATPGLFARISAASCSAEVKFNAMHLAPNDASIAAMADAAKPSFEWLDAAIQAADPVMTPIAQKAKTDLYVSMVVRMRNSIAPITMQTVGPALADHDQQHAALEPKLKAWLDQAH